MPEERYELTADWKRMAAFETIFEDHGALTTKVDPFQARATR